MTLVLTDMGDAGNDGVVMVADSAVTWRDRATGEVTRIENTACKLQRVLGHAAGISMWGLGMVGSIPTDSWVEDFIRTHKTARSIREFAEEMCTDLRRSVGPGAPGRYLGFHLAGFERSAGGRLEAVMYHLRNAEGTFGNFQSYNFTPQLEVTNRGLWRNGDFGRYAELAAVASRDADAQMAATGVPFAPRSAGPRLQFHTRWIKHVSDVYASSGECRRTIGGAVRGLIVRPDGTTVESIDDELQDA